MKWNDERPGVSVVLEDRNKKYIYKVPFEPNFTKGPLMLMRNLEYISFSVKGVCDVRKEKSSNRNLAS